MRTVLPTYLCREHQYFRQCFSVNAETCVNTMRLATLACIPKFEGGMPATFHQPADGKKWGEKVGSCAGAAYETTLLSSRKNNPRCNTPSAWTGPAQR